MKKIFRLLGVLLLLALVAAAVVARSMARRAVPDYSQDVFLRGMLDTVFVVRDAHAVPTVYARNEPDLYRAVGYVMAQDRLWQMDLLRRASTGRLSELFGEEFVATDLLLRSLQIPQKSQRVLERTDPVIVQALEAFADGVNQFIEQNPRNLPPEFSLLGYRPEPWLPVHSVNFTGFMAWEVGGEWSTELILSRLSQVVDQNRFLELLPDNYQQTEGFVHPGFILSALDSALVKPSLRLQQLGLEVFTGSNSWVVSGERTQSGKPLFAHDMHLFLFAPGIWYPMQQVVEGGLHVTGVVMPGQPFVVAGHNQHIAWGMTSTMADNVDFFRETINPNNHNQYRFNGQWADMQLVTEHILVRRKRPVEHQIRFTHRGPVISDFQEYPGQVISMKWLGNDYGNEVRSLYLLNRASNWDEFRHALSSFASIAQNISYADVHGNIGMQTAAGLPLRKGQGMFIVPGHNDAYDWQGIVPFEELPATYNPPEGFLIAANNRTVPHDYPHHISSWFAPPHRYLRIRQMLLETERLDIGDFRRMLADQKSKLAQEMLPVLLEELGKMPLLTSGESQAIRLLREWDLVYHPQSPQPLIFEKFLQQFVENLLLQQLGPELYQQLLADRLLIRNLVDRIWRHRQSHWLEHAQTGEFHGFTAVVHQSFTQAIAWIQDQLGQNPRRWEWGKVHQLTLVHPVGTVGVLNTLFRMNLGQYAPGGSFHTVCPYSYNPAEPFRILHGASHRHIYCTSNWDNSLSVIPTGTSGIPASPYYSDQTPMYVNNLYRNDRFSRQMVEQEGRYRMVIRIKN